MNIFNALKALYHKITSKNAPAIPLGLWCRNLPIIGRMVIRWLPRSPPAS